MPATASQDTVAYSAGGKVILVYGFGQSAGNLATAAAPGSTGPVGTITQAVYAAPLDLLQGTFTAAAPTFTSEASDTGNIFLTNSSYGTQAAALVFSTVSVINNSVSQAATVASAATDRQPPVYALFSPKTTATGRLFASDVNESILDGGTNDGVSPLWESGKT